MLRLSSSCDVVPQLAHRALIAAENKVGELKVDCHSVSSAQNRTWAIEVEVAGGTYVVAQVRGKTRFFLCFPVPYPGNRSGVRPFKTADELLRQLYRLEKK